MKKNLFLLLFLIGMANLTAQNILLPSNNKPSGWNVGGNIGFSAENQGLDLIIAPRIGKLITENLEFAFNVNYTFRKYYSTKFHIFGVGPEVNYFLNNFAGHISYLYNTVSTRNSFGKSTFLSENALFLGAGYRQHLGGNTYAQAGVRYNVLYKKENSIFSSAFTPYFGISVGL